MTEKDAWEELARKMDILILLGMSNSQAMHMAIKTQSKKGQEILKHLDICVKGCYLMLYMLVRSDKDKEEGAFYAKKFADEYAKILQAY
jgi:hypothetical protein